MVMLESDPGDVCAPGCVLPDPTLATRAAAEGLVVREACLLTNEPQSRNVLAASGSEEEAFAQAFQ